MQPQNRGVSVAQQVEHIPFKDGVLGSSPSWNTKEPGIPGSFYFLPILLSKRKKTYFCILIETTMRKVIYLGITILLLVSCKAQQKLVSVDTETHEVSLKKGQSCEIEFITNASTGFWWQWVNEHDINIVKSDGDRYESNAPKGMVGASSHRFWKFNATQKGTQTLHFVYARDNIEQAVRTRDVTITVK